jgi:hypothetical protein
MILQILFNANNKEFIGFGAVGHDQIKKSHLLIKEIEIENGAFNLARYVWSGNYDSGELIDLNKGKGIVLETDVDYKNYDIFARKFNLDFYATERICRMSFDEFQSFSAMRQSIVEKIEREKKFFSQSKYHVYIPKEEVKQKLETALAV